LSLYYFWCGGDKNEIILFGKLPGDKEAPKGIVMNYDPCDKCAANFALGILLIEVTTASNELEIAPGLYPTGRYSVLKREAAERIFTENFTNVDVPAIMRTGNTLLDKETFKMFIPDESMNEN
jgi:hypothetical protein